MKSLDEVVRWVLARPRERAIESIVVQDEYTHDVVVRDGDRWLVFDTT